METDRSVLIVTGMHRSGTSLTTSLLQSAGVYIGDRLMGEGTGNIKGHFEDLDFVDLHRDALTAIEVNREGWTRQTDLILTAEYLERAKALIEARSNYAVWGWKDPRTILFLNCWSKLIPEAKFIFVYRSPWEVVDSLFRRGDRIFKIDPQIAVETWISYNQAILKFCRQTEHHWILLAIEDVTQNSQLVVDLVARKFGLDLRSPQNLYDDSLLKKSSVNLEKARLIQQHFPLAFELYLQLNAIATLSNKTSVVLNQEFSPLSWFWQNWLDRPVAKVKTIRYWYRLRQSTISKQRSNYRETKIDLF